MKVVITPSFPQIANPGELLQLKDILVNLKEERLIPYETTISEFKLLISFNSEFSSLILSSFVQQGLE